MGSKLSAAQLPANEQQSLQKALFHAQHQVQPLNSLESAMPANQGVRFFASNPGQAITARFRDGEVGFASGLSERAWKGAFRLQRVAGRKVETNPVPTAHGARVEYAHDPLLTEWYENGPAGIEHGFTLSQRPSGLAGDLHVSLAVSGLKARPSSENVELVDPATNQVVLNYRKLLVLDATGAEVPSRMEVVSEDRVSLVIAEARATYPLTIDPLLTSQEAELAPEKTGDGAADDRFGSAVALSGDTALIGAWFDNTALGHDAGSAYLFRRVGTTWTLQAKISAPDGTGNAKFGGAVALAGDTALVGSEGKAYVFLRTGTTWAVQQTLSVPGSEWDRFGHSVALDGETALVGAPSRPTDSKAPDPSFIGQVFVFVRSGTAWNRQTTLFKMEATGGLFGHSLSLSGDTALIGAPAYNNESGCAYFFTRSGTVWSEQQQLMSPHGGGYSYFGEQVTLDGNTALATAPGSQLESLSPGAYVFVRNGSTWTYQVTLTPPDPTGDGGVIGRLALKGDTAAMTCFGRVFVFTRTTNAWTQQAQLLPPASVTYSSFRTISLDGDSILAGGQYDETEAGPTAGAASVFVRSGSTWTHQARLTAGDGKVTDLFGDDIALEGDTALIGRPFEDSPAGSDTGAAYVFVRSANAWTVQTRLAADVPVASDAFGRSVALSSGTALVGACGPYANLPGNVYVFVRSGTAWSQQARLGPEAAIPANGFGIALDLRGDTAVVQLNKDVSGIVQYVFEVFVRTGSDWTRQATLVSPDWTGGYYLYGLSFDGDTVATLVGGMQDPITNSFLNPVAYVFSRAGSAWSQPVAITSPEGETFAANLEVDGNTLVVGMGPVTDPVGGGYIRDKLAAVYARNGASWSRQGSLSVPGNISYYGKVALRGDIALAVDSTSTHPVTNEVIMPGVYVFQRTGNTWAKSARITPDEGSGSRQFGQKLAVSGDTVLVSDSGDGNEQESGSVFVFRLQAGESPYTTWAATQSLSGSGNLPASNPDADSADNLTEYAFNLNPRVSDSSTMVSGVSDRGLPLVTLAGGEPNQRLRVEYVRRKASTNPGISYEVEFGSELELAWTEQGGAESVTSLDETWERVVVEDGTVSAGATRRFARVRITLLP